MPDWLSLCVLISLLSLLTVAALLLYSGLLCDIIVQTGCPPIKKITFAYKFKEGPYKDCGQLFRESSSIGPGLATIGVFYDDPKKVPGTLCRCAVGSILSEGENKADEELLKRYETSGFNVFSFPEVTHMVTTSFPHRTFLSALLGIMRVYPRLDHYIKERRLCAHPFLEIYRDSQIQFMAPLARQGDFYVPESRVEVALSSVAVNDNVTDSDAPVTPGSTQPGQWSIQATGDFCGPLIPSPPLSRPRRSTPPHRSRLRDLINLQLLHSWLLTLSDSRPQIAPSLSDIAHKVAFCP
uniref:Testis expressed 264, ER-phagy receptor n=1 Tax=Stegastes partitus TaxID=144197 RepID=A0A3B5B744_9TELE